LFDKTYTFYAPNFLFIEIFNHKEKIKKFSKLDDSDLYFYLNGILERIQFIPIEIISSESRKKAYDLCKEIDLKDIPFIGLSLELNIPLWTGDKKLKDGLKSQGFYNFLDH
jgi:predicted nucleic acid-binding protein